VYSTWTPDDAVVEAMRDHLATRPGYLTKAEQVAESQEIERQAKELLQNLPAPSEVELKLTTDLERQLVERGVYTPKEAGKAVDMVRAMAHAQASAFGMDPDDLFAEYSIQIAGGTKEIAVAPAHAVREDPTHTPRSVEAPAPSGERPSPEGAGGPAPAAATPSPEPAAAPSPGEAAAPAAPEDAQLRTSAPRTEGEKQASPARAAPGDGKVSPLGALTGLETTVVTPHRPQGEPAHYQVIEASQLIPSHNPETFQPSAAYPEGVQEREYHRQPEEQAKVVVGSQALNPALLLTDSPTAVDGPPIVTAGPLAVVLGGNGRSMMILRAMKTEAARLAYRDALEQKAAQFGIDPAELAGKQMPILVRVLDSVASSDDKAALIAAVRRTNEGLTQALSPKARAVAEAKTLTPEVVRGIAQVLGENDEWSLRDALRERPKELSDLLRQDGVISPNNASSWLAGGEFTDEGKDRLEGMFLGRVIGTGDRMAATSPSLLNKLGPLTAGLLKVAGLNPSFDEIPQVQRAVDLLNDAARRGLQAEEIAGQQDLFGGATYGSIDLAMAQILRDEKQRDLRRRFAEWEALAAFDPRQGNLFGNPTRTDARGALFKDKGLVLYQSAFHGTRARDIPRFSLEKVGTGEGAQAYGWGLYFAQNRNVAEAYRRALSEPMGMTIDGKRWDRFASSRGTPKEAAQERIVSLAQALHQLGHALDPMQILTSAAVSIDDAIAAHVGYRETLKEKDLTDFAKQTISEEVQGSIEKLEAQKAALRELAGHDIAFVPSGQLYEVDIPEPDELLDWDLSLVRQPLGVLEQLVAGGILPHGFVELAAASQRLFDIEDEIGRIAWTGVEVRDDLEKQRDEAIAAQDAAGEKLAPMWNAPNKSLLQMPNGERVHYASATGRMLYQALMEATALPLRNTNTPEQQKALEQELRDLAKQSDQLEPGSEAHDEVAARIHEVKKKLTVPQFLTRPDVGGFRSPDEFASKWLLQLGIPGLTYLDGFSRARGDGSNNIVVWDEGRIAITKTYYQSDKNPKNLLVQHNLTAENLLHADELGGLAAPSIAIGRKEHPLFDFGEITLLAKPETFAPETGTPVFASDIYSPRHPRAHWKLDDKALGKLRAQLGASAKESGGYVSDLSDRLEKYGVQGALERAPRAAFEHLFLKERGELPETPMQPARLEHSFLEMPALQSFFRDRGVQQFQEGDEYHQALTAAWRAAADEFAAKVDDRELADDLRDDRISQNGLLEISMADTLRRMAPSIGTTEIDKHAFEDALDAAVDRVGRETFEAWVAEKVRPVLKEQRLRTGYNRSVPYTLTNVLRQVTKGLRAGENFNFGLGTARAAGSKRFRTTAGIQSERDSIVSSDEFKEAKAKIDDRFGQLSDEMGRYHHGDAFRKLDALAEAIAESYKRGKYLSAELRKSGFEGVPPGLVQEVSSFAADLLKMPTEYFEAKPQRIVNLDEFQAAVVPDNVDPRVFEVLARHGIHVDVYGREGEDVGALESSRRAAIERAGKAHDLFFQTGAPEGYRGSMRRTGNDFTITLTPKADRTTFLHEMGHVFLEIMGDLAARPDAPARVRADYQTLLAWFGVDSREGIEREHHEKFARGFERYLMEGKHPRKGLLRIYDSFKRWLKEEYRNVAALHVELSDDVRGVMDRLLAAETETRNVQRSFGLVKPIFKSAEEMGIPPLQYAAFLEEMQRATTASERAAEFKLLKEDAREATQDWKDARAAAKEEASAAFEQQKGRIAWLWLRGKVAEPDGVLTPVQTPRLDRKQTEKLVGIDMARRFLTEKGGSHPDDLAQMLGFATGREMLEAAAAASDKNAAVEARTDQIMQERFPSLLEERQRLRDQVAKGVNGDHTAQWLMREYVALTKKSGVGAMRLEAIRRAAELYVEQVRVGQIRPHRFQQAARSAGERAFKQAVRQNWAAAAAAKMQQLLNMEIHRRIAKLKDEMDAARAYLRDSGRGDRGFVGLFSQDFLQLHDGLLQSVGLLEGKPERALEALDQAAAQAEEDGAEFTFDLDEVHNILASPRAWADLKPQQAREVRDAIEEIRHLARRAQTARVADQEHALQALEEKLIHDLEKLPDLGRPAADTALRSGGNKALGWVLGFAGRLIDIQTTLEALGDVGTMFFEGWKKQISQHQHLADEYLAALDERFKAIPRETLNARFDAIPELDTDLPLDPSKVNLAGPRSRLWLLMVSLNMGTEGELSNAARMLPAFGWTDSQVIDTLNKHLTKAEWEWRQSVLDLGEKLWPLIQAKEVRKYGVAPPKLPARSIQTPHGTFAGGYFPGRADPRPEVSNTAGERQVLGELQSIASLFGAAYRRGATPKSHTKNRVKGAVYIPNLNWAVVPKHVDQVLHDLAFDEFVRDAGRFFMRPGVKQALARRLGERRAREPLEWIYWVANQRAISAAQHTEEVGQLLDLGRNRLVARVLGWSLTNSAADLANAGVAMAIPPALGGTMSPFAPLAYLAALPIPGPSMASYYFARKFALEHSPELQRQNGYFTEENRMKHLRDLGRRRGPHRIALEAITNTIWFFQRQTQKIAGTQVFLARYWHEKYINDRSDEDAARLADLAITATQLTGNRGEAPSLLRNPGAAGAILTFWSYFAKLGGILHGRIGHAAVLELVKAKRAGIDPVQWAKSGVATAALAGSTLAVLFFAGPISELFAGHGPDDDEDEKLWAFRKMISGYTNTYPMGAMAEPVVGRMLEGKWRAQLNPRAAPLLNIAQQFVMGVEKMSSDEATDDEKLWAFLDLSLTAAGVPTSQARRTVGYLAKVAGGEESPEDPFALAAGVVYGKRDRQQQNPVSFLEKR
jgi:hypothetical protein